MRAIQYAAPESMRDAVALLNEFGARMASDHKGRFALFAVLPLPNIDASLREIEYAFDTLKAEGAGVITVTETSGWEIRCSRRYSKNSTGARR